MSMYWNSVSTAWPRLVRLLDIANKKDIIENYIVHVQKADWLLCITIYHVLCFICLSGQSQLSNYFNLCDLWQSFKLIYSLWNVYLYVYPCNVNFQSPMIEIILHLWWQKCMVWTWYCDALNRNKHFQKCSVCTKFDIYVFAMN